MQPSEETYQNYIKLLLEQKEDSTVIDTLYQRAIAAFPLSTDLWTQYLNFLVSFKSNSLFKLITSL